MSSIENLRPGSFGKALAIQRNVIYALLVRELKTRFGTDRLGYVWTFLEPAIHMIVLLIIFSFIRPDTNGVDFGVFLLTGLLPWITINNTINRCVNTVAANKGIFYFRNIKPLDTVYARVGLEFLLSGCVGVILLLWYILRGFHPYIPQPLTFITVLFLSIFMTIGFAVLAATFGALYKHTGTFIALIIRPLYFISGILFPMSHIPEPYQSWLWYNPYAHIIELFRQALLQGYVAHPEADPFYVFAFSCGIMFFALAVYRRKRFDMFVV